MVLGNGSPLDPSTLPSSPYTNLITASVGAGNSYLLPSVSGKYAHIQARKFALSDPSRTTLFVDEWWLGPQQGQVRGVQRAVDGTLLSLYVRHGKRVEIHHIQDGD